MAKEYVFAGFGGQGVLTAGMIFTEMMMSAGKQVAFMPSYGAEMRGGSANCCVKVDDHRIGSPLIEKTDYLMALNAPAIDSLEGKIRPQGNLLLNSDIVPDDRVYRDDITVLKIPCFSLARQVGNPRGLNLVMLGALIGSSALVERDFALAAVLGYFGKRGRGDLDQQNKDAFLTGYHYKG